MKYRDVRQYVTGGGIRLVTIESSMHVPEMRAERVIDFFLHPGDDLYRRWWPGTHFAMHPLNERVGLGQVVYMDELVGTRRLRFACVVTDLTRGSITWRFRRLVPLPCSLALSVVDDDRGATITHTIRAGFRSRFGTFLDPLLRLYFSPSFARMMEAHFTTEFSTLPAVLELDRSTSV